jgi:hypothetical protein
VSGELIFDWKLFFFPLMAVCYFQFVKYMDTRWSRKRPFSEEEILSYNARRRGLSEYQMFFIAAERWRVPQQRVEADFRDYLINGNLAYYVKDHVRALKNETSPPDR